ncbi:hypothetical protein Taro_007546 [Colocasia esculenta]|uniref:Uncharacterized protein n=1 Tax=Colocasia esculenta TaxID=4460 RepID=A0A843TUG4_COLES|nr:hypothetical protein [Colocasia esculenta]
MYHKTLRAYIDKGNVDSQMDYLECCHVIEDREFWDKVACYLKVVTPLVKVFRMVDDDDKNDMGYLYKAMDRAEMELRQSLPRDYKKWWKIIDHRWENTLHRDLHVADSRPITPRMVKPPPSSRRTISEIYMIERASAAA